MLGTLYLVATPIGNLKDITHRAVEILRTVDLIACEDTRHTLKLLNALEIENKLISYHEHNEEERSKELATRLEAGESVAVVSDAGTPGINDPGFRLVQKAIEAGADVVPIPGAVAFVNAAIASGLPTDAIYFGGFLPSKASERRKRLGEVKAVPATLVFYESPHRLAKSLADCLNILGDRDVAVCRELTKLHEEIVRGRLSELSEKFETGEVRGEIVLVIDRKGDVEKIVPSDKAVARRVDELIAQGVDHRAALKTAAKEFGVSKSEAYRLLQSEKQ